jgi:hypothetical protein
MRVFIAGLIGAVVMFVWGAMAHMFLGLGDRGVHLGTPYQATLAALKQDAAGPGIYYLPSTTEDKMQDPAAQAALGAESAGMGYAWIVYAPGGNPGNVDMMPNLGKQFATDLLSALIAAFVLSLVALGFGKRVLVATLMGVFAWLVVSVTYWNWYLFPLDYTLGLLGKFAIGWALAGAAIAWWLGRGERHA